MDEPVENGRTEATDYVVGIFMILLSIACALAYSIILKGIYSDKELFRLTSYKFMFFLGVYDVIQCFPHAMTGVFTICQSTFSYDLAKIMGVLATPGYVAYAVMTVILSFNRFVQLSSPRLEYWLFGPRGVKCWIGFGALCFILYACALGSPYASIIYDPVWYSWAYDNNLEYSWLVQRIEMYIEIGGIFISAFFYTLVLGILYKTRVHFQSSKNFHVEIKILIQALVITAYCTVLNVFWHNYEVLLPANLWSYCGLNIMWILNSGIYPIIYFVVNKTIREKVRTGTVTAFERTIASRETDMYRQRSRTRIVDSNDRVQAVETSDDKRTEKRASKLERKMMAGGLFPSFKKKVVFVT